MNIPQNINQCHVRMIQIYVTAISLVAHININQHESGTECNNTPLSSRQVFVLITNIEDIFMRIL